MLSTDSVAKVATKVLVVVNGLLFWLLIVVKPQLNVFWLSLVFILPVLMLIIPLAQGILIFLRRKEFSLIPLKENSSYIFTASIFTTIIPIVLFCFVGDIPGYSSPFLTLLAIFILLASGYGVLWFALLDYKVKELIKFYGTYGMTAEKAKQIIKSKTNLNDELISLLVIYEDIPRETANQIVQGRIDWDEYKDEVQKEADKLVKTYDLFGVNNKIALKIAKGNVELKTHLLSFFQKNHDRLPPSIIKSMTNGKIAVVNFAEKVEKLVRHYNFEFEPSCIIAKYQILLAAVRSGELQKENFLNEFHRLVDLHELSLESACIIASKKNNPELVKALSISEDILPNVAEKILLKEVNLSKYKLGVNSEAERLFDNYKEFKIDRKLSLQIAKGKIDLKKQLMLYFKQNKETFPPIIAKNIVKGKINIKKFAKDVNELVANYEIDFKIACVLAANQNVNRAIQNGEIKVDEFIQEIHNLNSLYDVDIEHACIIANQHEKLELRNYLVDEIMKLFNGSKEDKVKDFKEQIFHIIVSADYAIFDMLNLLRVTFQRCQNSSQLVREFYDKYFFVLGPRLKVLLSTHFLTSLLEGKYTKHESDFRHLLYVLYPEQEKYSKAALIFDNLLNQEKSLNEQYEYFLSEIKELDQKHRRMVKEVQEDPFFQLLRGYSDFYQHLHMFGDEDDGKLKLQMLMDKQAEIEKVRESMRRKQKDMQPVIDGLTEINTRIQDAKRGIDDWLYKNRELLLRLEKKEESECIRIFDQKLTWNRKLTEVFNFLLTMLKAHDMLYEASCFSENLKNVFDDMFPRNIKSAMIRSHASFLKSVYKRSIQKIGDGDASEFCVEGPTYFDLQNNIESCNVNYLIVGPNIEQINISPSSNLRDATTIKVKPGKYTIICEPSDSNLNPLILAGNCFPGKRYPVGVALVKEKRDMPRDHGPSQLGDGYGIDWGLFGAIELVPTEPLYIIIQGRKFRIGRYLGEGASFLKRDRLPISIHKELFCTPPCCEDAMLVSGFVYCASIPRDERPFLLDNSCSFFLPSGLINR